MRRGVTGCAARPGYWQPACPLALPSSCALALTSCAQRLVCHREQRPLDRPDAYFRPGSYLCFPSLGHVHFPLPTAALTIARIPVFTASGKTGHASVRSARSGYFRANVKGDARQGTGAESDLLEVPCGLGFASDSASGRCRALLTAPAMWERQSAWRAPFQGR